MAVNKNFVVKNGIEVATDLIFASSDLDKVGIGSTIPTQLLEVGGDAKITGNTELVGVTTLSSSGGITTTGGDFYVGGDLYVSDDITIDEFTGRRVNVSTAITTKDLLVTGIATFGDGTGADVVDINADVDMDANLHLTGFSTFTQLIDADNGIDASTLKVEDLTDNRIVISGTGGELEDDSNLTFDGSEFNVGSAVSIYSSSGIVSATEFHGDGSNLSGVVADSGGSLGFSTANSIGYGVTFLKFVGAGVSTLSAPHSGIATLTIVGGGGGGSANIGIGTTVGDAFSGIVTSGNLWYNTNEARLFIYYFDGSSSQWVDAAPFNIGIITSSLGSLNQGTALSPPLAFSGDSSTGLFSPTSGQQTLVSVGASILNINPGGIEVTGIVTSSGLKVGTGISIVGTGIAATAFYGDGSQLTGITAGATLSAGSGASRVVLTTLTSGTMTSAQTDAELTYNSGTDTLTATNFSGALSGDATGLSGTPNITVGNISASGGDLTIRNITGVAATFTGVLTYEDVTNVDSIGVITARSGIKFGSAGVGGTITADGHAEFVGTCTATKFIGDGSELTGISVGITTTASSPSANTVVTLNLGTAQHHDLTLSAGITTITCTGGNFGESHSVVITQPSSGIATVGFSTYFLFPSGSTPSMSEGSGKIDLLSFVVKKVGSTGIGTQLLASAGLNYQ